MTYLHINQQLASEPPVDMTLLLDAGNAADGAAGGAGGEGGVGLEGLRDLAGTGCGLPCRCTPGLHCRATLGQLLVGEVDAQDAFGNVDLDGIALFDQSKRVVLGCLGRDVSDAEAGAAAGEAAVGDERADLTQSLGLEIAGGVEHLLHARAAARAFVADEDDIAGNDPVAEDARAEEIVAVDALRGADDLAVAHGGEHVDAEGLDGSAGSGCM